MTSPVYLESDYLSLEISIVRPKYASLEKAPIIIVKNKEIDLELRLILEDYFNQTL
jgi:hypothetical protein